MIVRHQRHFTSYLTLVGALAAAAGIAACGSGGSAKVSGSGDGPGADGAAPGADGGPGLIGWGDGGVGSSGGGSSGGGSSGAGSSGAGSSGAGGSGGPTLPDASSARGNFTAPDCQGCSFPAMNAPACPSTAPSINVVYPNDSVLVPPNMSVMSVQWTPFGAPFTEFEVDFSNAITDTRVITKCSTQTWDTGQPPMQSGGCELIVDPATWTFLVNANRGGDPVTITVRGTTDGMCASTSMNSVKMSFASDDVLGAIYYWKSTVTPNGVGGQIWVKSFGDSVPEKQVTGVSNSALAASCNGCHSLSRDGLRMVIYSDDDDSDDEYGDVTGSLLDMTAMTPLGTAYAGRGSGQPPGFSTLYPDHSYYVTSNGTPQGATNTLALWSGNAGTLLSTVTFGNAGDRPTMPDWSPDGKNVIYVLPTKVGAWDQGGGGGGGGRNDDDHVFGGSLYTLPYFGNQQFGGPTPFLMSAGENNYYPSYSPDGQFVAFDRAPHDTSVATLDGCNGTAPQRSCPNDSFSNPAARVMLVANAAGSAPVDLENANGSATASPVPVSNSWPRWSPFLQQYKGNKLLWIAFSSTRDYGVRVRNHKTGMYQCYPADSYQDPGAAHHQAFAAQCQQPQLWMAAINLSAAAGSDPSRVAFWLPFQDITTHNHTPQWTQAEAPPPPGSGSSSGGGSSGGSSGGASSGGSSGGSSSGGGACIPSSGNCVQNPGACCQGTSCQANGTCQPLIF
jgi:uncharacterized membrane protein YgcG